MRCFLPPYLKKRLARRLAATVDEERSHVEAALRYVKKLQAESETISPEYKSRQESQTTPHTRKSSYFVNPAAMVKVLSDFRREAFARSSTPDVPKTVTNLIASIEQVCLVGVRGSGAQYDAGLWGDKPQPNQLGAKEPQPPQDFYAKEVWHDHFLACTLQKTLLGHEAQSHGKVWRRVHEATIIEAAENGKAKVSLLMPIESHGKTSPVADLPGVHVSRLMCEEAAAGAVWATKELMELSRLGTGYRPTLTRGEPNFCHQVNAQEYKLANDSAEMVALGWELKLMHGENERTEQAHRSPLALRHEPIPLFSLRRKIPVSRPWMNCVAICPTSKSLAELREAGEPATGGDYFTESHRIRELPIREGFDQRAWLSGARCESEHLRNWIFAKSDPTLYGSLLGASARRALIEGAAYIVACSLNILAIPSNEQLYIFEDRLLFERAPFAARKFLVVCALADVEVLPARAGAERPHSATAQTEGEIIDVVGNQEIEPPQHEAGGVRSRSITTGLCQANWKRESGWAVTP